MPVTRAFFTVLTFLLSIRTRSIQIWESDFRCHVLPLTRSMLFRLDRNKSRETPSRGREKTLSIRERTLTPEAQNNAPNEFPPSTPANRFSQISISRLEFNQPVIYPLFVQQLRIRSKSSNTDKIPLTKASPLNLCSRFNRRRISV